MLRGSAAVAALVCAFAACDRDGNVVPLEPVTPIQVGGGGPGSGGGDSGGAGGSGGGGGEGGGDLAPVYLGLAPTAVSDDGSEPGGADLLLAELTTFAAGVRAQFIEVPWDELDQADLAARIADAKSRELRVVVTLLVVDGRADRRPFGLTGSAFDAPATVLALEDALDQVLAAADGGLDALVLARDADWYAAELPSSAAALTTLLAAGIDHLAGAELALGAGVGLSHDGAPSDDYQALAALGTVAAYSYLPGLDEGVAPAPSAAADLDRFTKLAGERPIVLLGAGYPSSDEAGGSPEIQQQFLADLFAALAPRRRHFPLVLVRQLHDWTPGACDDYVLQQGDLPGSAFASYVCTVGLRETDATAKPSWSAFLAGAATFSAP